MFNKVLCLSSSLSKRSRDNLAELYSILTHRYWYEPKVSICFVHENALLPRCSFVIGLKWWCSPVSTSLGAAVRRLSSISQLQHMAKFVFGIYLFFNPGKSDFVSCSGARRNEHWEAKKKEKGKEKEGLIGWHLYKKDIRLKRPKLLCRGSPSVLLARKERNIYMVSRVKGMNHLNFSKTRKVF